MRVEIDDKIIDIIIYGIPRQNRTTLKIWFIEVFDFAQPA